MNAEELAARIPGAKRQGGRWVARCPAHDDRRESLSFADGHKGVVVKCHAGCTVEQITAAVGCAVKDLFPAAPSARAADGRIVAEYPYRDEEGKLLFEVVRFEPKDFRQRVPDPGARGGWRWSLNGVRRVVFRLPECIRWLRDEPEGTLFVCEGEKDVEAIIRAGGRATCNAGGAGKWLPEYREQLAGWKRVVVVADKDEPGRKHARQVATCLAEPGREVRIVEVPGEGKDAADYLERGGTLEGLLAVEGQRIVAPAESTQATSQAALPPAVYDLARGRWFVPSGCEWIPMTETRIATYFKAHGFSEYVRDAMGVSVLESAMQQTVMERNVSWAGEVAGYWPGPVEMIDRRILITRGPNLPAPAAGEWETLRGILEPMLASDAECGATQWALFHGWVWSAYQALRDRTFRPGLALALCGKSNCGKSQLSLLLTRILGGRSANPYSFLIGRTDFNEELIGAEVLTIDDEASERDIKSRQALGQNIKKLIVGVTQRAHGKGAKGMTVRNYCRLVMCLNDDPHDLMVLPPLEDSIRNKFLILRVTSAAWPEEPREFRAMMERCYAEIPAYLAWLEKEFTLPEALRSARFGVTAWQHPVLALELEDLHPWRRLMELIDHCRPWAPKEGDAEVLSRDTWEGTVQDLEDLLRVRAPGRAAAVLDGPQRTGLYLRAAADRLPERIGKRLSMGKTIWMVRRPGGVNPP
jgi:hypothetical protein